MTNVRDTTSATPLPPTGSSTAKTNSGASDVATSTNNATNPSGKGAAPASSSSSVISISTLSTQLQAAQSTSSSDAVFSTSKVNEIKAAIASGQFKVNSSNVAAALIAGVHDLLNSGKQSTNQ